MIERSIFILLSLALVGSLGGFFLYVPMLPVLDVTVIIGGLCAMFWLGIRVGRQPHNRGIPDSPSDRGSQLSLS
jgi:hypothetical protein